MAVGDTRRTVRHTPPPSRYAPIMELLRHVVVLLHIVGFAVTFGAWAAEGVARPFRTTRLMDYGLLVSLVTGLALAVPRALFASIGVLSFAAAGIAVLW